MKQTNHSIGVVLFQLGGPDSLEAVGPFLENLFSDPDIIDFPFAWIARKTLAKAIARRRAQIVRENLRAIGGKSPILEITQRQASALEKTLNKQFPVKVVVAMRYSSPFTETAINELLKEEISRIILLPLYPQYSQVTTGSAMNEWNRVISRQGINHFDISLIHDYPTHPLYLKALSQRIDEALQRFPSSDRQAVHFLFSAHSIPAYLLTKGDPYKYQIEATMNAVMELRNFDHPFHLSFQSRVGPVKWLEPSTIDMVQYLARGDVRNLIVIPIAFTSDHIETLYELNIQVRKIAHEAGIKQYEVAEALNDSPFFIQAMADLVLTTIANSQGAQQ
ncbi:MAG: ferrochelatase [Bacteroidota bacterium]